MQGFAFRWLKEDDLSVFAVITSGTRYLPGAEAAHPLGNTRPRRALDGFKRRFPQNEKFRTERMKHRFVLPLRLLPCGGDTRCGGDQLLQRHQAFIGLCAQRKETRRAIGQRKNAVLYADGELPAANRAFAAQTKRFLGLEANAAIPVAIQMVFSFFRKKFNGARKSFPRLDGLAKRCVGKRSCDAVGLPAELCRRVCIRIGNEREAVKRADAPVHGRIRGKAGFKGMDFAHKVFKAFLNGIEPGKRAEERKVRRPDVRGNEHGFGANGKRNFKQIAAIKPQDWAPVRADVPYGLKALRKRFCRVKPRQED